MSNQTKAAAKLARTLGRLAHEFDDPQYDPDGALASLVEIDECIHDAEDCASQLEPHPLSRRAKAVLALAHNALGQADVPVQWAITDGTDGEAVRIARDALQRAAVRCTDKMRALEAELEAAFDDFRTAPEPCIEQEPGEPVALLLSWREIAAALGRKNEPEFRESLKGLNDKHCGPIITPGRGSQPKVDRGKLLAWWNTLESRLQELDSRKQDAAATVASQYNHGKTGRVAPDIRGEIKSRRTD